jgi:hypothetical protein
VEVKNVVSAKSHFDLDDPDLLSRFTEAADNYMAANLTSKANARRALMRDGIVTKSARLTKKYSK